MPRLLLAAAFAFAAAARAQEPPPKIIPPPGVAPPAEEAAKLRAGLAELKAELDALPAALKGKPALLELLPDVEVFHKAVRYALDYNEFFDKNGNDLRAAYRQLDEGKRRARELKEGKPSWPGASGLVVRGYRSKIDGSVQPYGLVVPEGRTAGVPGRLDVWWHARGETLSEVQFLAQRMTSPGEFTPRGAIVLHPYGRYCNANKFAGEVDTLECLEHVKKHYPVDESRIVARGFSMGGAACWQFATHFPTLWCAAAPGAGFAETAEFVKIANDKVPPAWYEQRLWAWYNATDHAQNLFNLPTVAYSGEIDGQKQAADVMMRELNKVGLELAHVIGPKTAHKYEAGAKDEINRRIDAIAAKGKDPCPTELRFVVRTLRYNRCAWIQVDGLEKHWATPGVVTAKLSETNRVAVETSGVTALTIDLPAGSLLPVRDPVVLIDKEKVHTGVPVSDRSFRAHFRKVNGKWTTVASPVPEGLAKVPGLQGPIDDAFCSRFVFVRPTGQPASPQVGAWAKSELERAVRLWRSQFRGDAVVKDDTAVTDADIAESNLILWGDVKSNAVLAKLADKLPVRWQGESLVAGKESWPASTHAPVLVYPNPLNAKKYVVLNSGFTFREAAMANNARQIAALPDFAVVDVSVPPDGRKPGKVARAGFFDERWQLQEGDGR